MQLISKEKILSDWYHRALTCAQYFSREEIQALRHLIFNSAVSASNAVEQSNSAPNSAIPLLTKKTTMRTISRVITSPLGVLNRIKSTPSSVGQEKVASPIRYDVSKRHRL